MLRSNIAITAGTLAALWLGLAAAPANAQTATTYSGRAFGVQLHTTLPTPNTVWFADTGELPSSGGSLSASLASVASGPLSSGAVTCSSQGSAGAASSAATVLNLSAYGGTAASITASEVRARADATCGSAVASTTITGLAVGGLQVVVTGAPNQTLVIAGLGTLVINEQLPNGPTDITVNALHLRLLTGEELIVCSAHSDVTCVTPSRQGSWGELKHRYD